MLPLCAVSCWFCVCLWRRDKRTVLERLVSMLIVAVMKTPTWNKHNRRLLIHTKKPPFQMSLPHYLPEILMGPPSIMTPSCFPPVVQMNRFKDCWVLPILYRKLPFSLSHKTAWLSDSHPVPRKMDALHLVHHGLSSLHSTTTPLRGHQSFILIVTPDWLNDWFIDMHNGTDQSLICSDHAWKLRSHIAQCVRFTLSCQTPVTE